VAESDFDGNLEFGVRRSVLSWYVWQEYGFTRCEMFSHWNQLIHKCYTFCTFSDSFKDNATVNYITIKCRRVSYPSSLAGHTE
jgi:hypothetical protein